MRQLVATGQWAAAAAHEVKNPLAAVTLSLDGLIRTEQDAARKELLLRARARLDDIHAVVAGLLEYAKPREPALAPLDPAVLVERVLAQVDGTLRNKGAVVRSRLATGIPRVEGDQRLLGQVLINLVLNAVEARPQGLELELDVETAQAGPTEGPGGRRVVRFRVLDNGPGISGEELGRIFEPFHSTKPKGTGLGLAISRDIVGRHGGTLTVQSAPGKGACFIVELPA